MIRGFENITNELSFQEEREILPFVIGGLKTKIGKSNSITGSEIVRKMNSFFPESQIQRINSQQLVVESLERDLRSLKR